MKKILFLFLILSSFIVDCQSHLYDLEPKSEVMKSIAQHYIQQDYVQLEMELKELQAKKTWNQSELLYAKTVLDNLPKNARLITNGITDTYPILYLQTVEKFRSDVKLIPLTFFQYDTYKNGFIELKLQPELYTGVNEKLLTYLLQNTLFTPIHIANTVPKNLFESHIKNLYALGLSFRYSTNSIKNSIDNVQQWDKTQQIIQDLNETEAGKKLTPNFLPTLMNLYVHFQSKNNKSEQEKVKKFIDEIGNNIQQPNLFKVLGL